LSRDFFDAQYNPGGNPDSQGTEESVAHATTKSA
jgi:hypothetical protein